VAGLLDRCGFDAAHGAGRGHHLDPVNRNVIDQALQSGQKDFIGGNCTVSLI